MHPSVKWVHTGSICLRASHGCLLSSQSSLAPSLPTFPFLFMREHKAVGLSSQGSSRHLLRRPQVLFFPCPNEQGNEKAFLESVKENPSFFPRGITEQRLLSENVLISKEHNDPPPPPQHPLLKGRLPGFVEVPECSELRCTPYKLFAIWWVQPTAP